MLKFIILKLFTIFILLSYFYLVRTHGNIRKKRIVGGNVISFSKIPYIVSIQQWRFQVHQCGGSIIGEKWVLTSAHCHISVVKFTRRYFVLVGSNYKATKGYHFNIIDSFKHPNFSRISMDYDIELLKLSKSIIKHTGGQIIKLPKINDPVRTGQVVRVSGWGWNKYEVDNLRSVELDIIDHKKCNNIYSDRVNITENMICASSPGKDACHSDSGGPMTITDYGNENDPNDDHEILVGIISWGAGCADTKYPGVYTKVSAFIQWIADTQKHRILGHHFRNTKFYDHKKY